MSTWRTETDDDSDGKMRITKPMFTNREKGFLCGFGVVIVGMFFVLVMLISSLTSPFNGPFNSFTRFCSRNTAWCHSPELRNEMIADRKTAVNNYFACLRHNDTVHAVMSRNCVIAYCNMLGDDCKPLLDSMDSVAPIPKFITLEE